MLKNSLPFWFLIFWFKTSFIFPLPQRFFALSQVFWHFTCALVSPCFHPFVLDILGLFHSANSCLSVLEKWSWNNSGIISYPRFSLFSHSSTTVIFNWTSWTSPLTFSTGCSSFPFFSLSLSLSLHPLFTLALSLLSVTFDQLSSSLWGGGQFLWMFLFHFIMVVICFLLSLRILMIGFFFEVFFPLAYSNFSKLFYFLVYFVCFILRFSWNVW